MKILGIETSCDETGASVIEANTGDKKVKLLSNVVTSSLPLHKKTGGIIPETAARQQIRYIIPVIQKALSDSNLYPPSSKNNLPSSTFYRPDIDAIAVTIGPGLIGSLLVGVETAKTLAYAWNKPIVPVNHLIGHIYANWIKCHNRHAELARLAARLASMRAKRVSASRSQQNEIADQVRNDKKIEFPAIALIVSGGHTDLVLIKDHQKIKWLGGTRDDAAGEAFDKIGRLLGLPYPGGPAIEKVSQHGDSSRFTFPRPMFDSNDFDFSFSGLKTAVMRNVMGSFPRHRRGQDNIADIAASVQQAVIDVLVVKTLKAAQEYKTKSILLGGGVSANQKLRDELKLKIPFFAPEKWLCTDNAAMIATAAFFNYKPTDWHKLNANSELYFY